MVLSIIITYTETGSAAYRAGNLRLAGRMFFAAAKEARRLDASDPYLSCVFANLGLFYHQQRRLHKALASYRRALRLIEGSGATSSEAELTVRLAAIYHDQGKHAAAAKLYKRTLALEGKAIGGDRIRVHSAFAKLVGIYAKLGKYAQAERWCRAAVEDEERQESTDQAFIIHHLYLLSFLCSHQGKHYEANLACEKLIAIRETEKFAEGQLT